VNDQIPINRFQSERVTAWVPVGIIPPPTISGPPTSFSSGPAMVRHSRTIKSDEGYGTNSQLDAQSIYSISTWNMNQDQRNIQRKRMPLPSPESAHLLPEGARQRHESDQIASFIDGNSTTGEPTLQSPSEHGSPELSVAGDTCEAASNWSVSCEEQGIELPNELLPIQAKLVEQIKADYILNWRACLGHIRSRPSQQSASTSRQQRLETSRSSRPPPPSAKSLGKRRREEGEDPDDVPSSDDDHKRRRATCEVDDSESKLFACPYAKYNPTRYSERNEVEASYRGCSSKLLRNIGRVKQHLYRTHTRPAQYCPRCGREFDRQDFLEAHIRETTTCNLQELPFKEKMTAEQKDSVHKKTPGKHPRKAWLEIFRILFPGAREPSSPYAETGSPEAIQDFLAFFKERGPQRISATIMRNELSLERYAPSMLDAAVETAVQDLVREYGNDFHCLPADNSQYSNDPGPLAEISTTVPVIPEAVNPSLQQLEAGLSLTDHTGSGSNAASFVAQQPAEQLTEFPEWYPGYPCPADESAYYQNLGSNMLIASANSNHILQGQMPMPIEMWRPGTLNQPQGRRLQRIVEGA
jgi:hypothetical protein